jgi:uncharacterized protein YjbI with pentapeptide repeats
MAKLTEQEQIAPDESIGTEPEIEAVESPEAETEKEPDESAAAKGGKVEVGCLIEWGYRDPKCGRELHAAPDGVDEQPVCLMHSNDPGKQSGPLFDTFWQEFERILEEAGGGEAHFERFVFPKLDFSKRKFQAICRFNYATFTQNADFFKATFTRNADFTGATFTQYSYFWNATFTQDAEFCRATFTKDANFNDATFTQNANFFKATFTQAARFEKTKFHGTAVWHSSRFLDQAEFRGTKFEPLVEGQHSAVFALAKFSKPGEIVFDDVDLSRVLFHNCDVSQVCFTSVRWAKREGNRGLAVFEETIDLEQYARGLKRDGQRDFRAVAQIYQQLKKNYDSRLDYWTANEFHFGEMEMMRLAGPARGLLFRGRWMRRLARHIRQQFMRLRQWWHPRLSFVALSLYKYASDYGNSYGKPLAWLLGVLLAAALLFPFPGVGLKQPISGNAANSASVTYSRVWNRQDSLTNNLWTEAKLIGKSGITAIDTATFQRTPEYTPVYPLGRVLAIVETLLTSSLFALFLLAIRRQFRR